MNGTNIRHVEWQARLEGRVWWAWSWLLPGSTVVADGWDDLLRLISEHTHLYVPGATSWFALKPEGA